jgi:hypothetical protein
MSSSILETVVILREDHPNKWVTINKTDLKPDDVIYSEPLTVNPPQIPPKRKKIK